MRGTHGGIATMMTATGFWPAGVNRAGAVHEQRAGLPATVALILHENGNAMAMGIESVEYLLKCGRRKMTLDMVRRKKDFMRLHIHRHATTIVTPGMAGYQRLHAGGGLPVGLVQLRHTPSEDRQHLSGHPHREQTLPHFFDGPVEHLKTPGSGKRSRHGPLNHSPDRTATTRARANRSRSPLAKSHPVLSQPGYKDTATACAERPQARSVRVFRVTHGLGGAWCQAAASARRVWPLRPAARGKFRCAR